MAASCWKKRQGGFYLRRPHTRPGSQRARRAAARPGSNFLKDYAKRVDISGANLLVFIAFNFTLGSDLPRLGYLTFLDAILIIAFIVTALTVICNVALKRWDTAGKKDLIDQIDTYILWGYPFFYIVGILILI